IIFRPYSYPRRPASVRPKTFLAQTRQARRLLDLRRIPQALSRHRDPLPLSWLLSAGSYLLPLSAARSSCRWALPSEQKFDFPTPPASLFLPRGFSPSTC